MKNFRVVYAVTHFLGYKEELIWQLQVIEEQDVMNPLKKKQMLTL